jgi:hypothetical protein
MVGLRVSAVKSLKAGCHGGTPAPPAMGAHFSGLSLKKWPPGRAALKACFGKLMTVVRNSLAFDPDFPDLPRNTIDSIPKCNQNETA